jgi:hypothetical protein
MLRERWAQASTKRGLVNIIVGGLLLWLFPDKAEVAVIAVGLITTGALGLKDDGGQK